MRVTSKWLIVLLLLAVLPLSGCGFMQKLQSRDDVNKGVKQFTDQKYDAAVQYFEKAIELDPEFETAYMYLATAYMAQFVPGSTDPRSEQMVLKAIESFKWVVDHAESGSKNKMNAMLYIASLYYQMKKSDESKSWCNRVLATDPQNAEAYYRIAVIDYDFSLGNTGVQGENVEYLKPEEKAATQKNIEEGLTCLNKAIEIRPDYFDAMEFQNLLYREKAKFEKDEKVKAELLRQADIINQKSLALSLKAKEADAKKPKKLGNIGGK